MCEVCSSQMQRITPSKMERLCVFVVLTLFCGFQSSAGNAGDDLNKLEEEYGQFRQKKLPESSTGYGHYKYNDLVESFAIEAFTEERDKTQDILNKLNNIPYASLNAKEKTDFDIFNETLHTVVRGYEWRNYSALNPANFLEGPHVDQSQLSRSTPFDTVGDYENYLARLFLIPNQLDEMMVRFKEAIRLNRTYNKVSVNRIPQMIAASVKDEDPAKSGYYKPFRDSLPTNTRISESTKMNIKQRANASITTIIGKFKELKDFLNDTYLGHTRKGYGVSSWDKGGDYYKECLRWHLSLDMSPEEVHQTGLSEVARISGQMRLIMKRLNHEGTVKEFFDSLKNNASFTFKSSEEMLNWYNNTIQSTIRSKLPQYFKDLPDLPLEIKPHPVPGVAGQYIAGPADGSRPGQFLLDVSDPTHTPTIAGMALALHETNPGHHLQISVASTSKIASYRKDSAGHFFNVPFEVPFFTSYVEGWGLYSEYLGQEMGLYTDDFTLMGRYSLEIFRACRLVVDTGLHYKNWTREEAIEYMLNYTTLSERTLTVEIDRYITWPGQACSYKIGELKIRELRATAERELGAMFDIKEFHHVILKDGSMPLSVLEKIVYQWIESVKNTRKTTTAPINCDGASSATKITNSRYNILTFLMIILPVLFVTT